MVMTTRHRDRSVVLAALLGLSTPACYDEGAAPSSTGGDDPLFGGSGGGGGEGGQPGEPTDAATAIGAPTDTAEQTALERACDGFARATCAKLASCAPGLHAHAYGLGAAGVARCEERSRLQCTYSGSLADTFWTPTLIKACGDSLAALACSRYFLDDQPACRGYGRRPDGATCASADQCQGGRCTSPSATTCGTCARESGPGGPCDKDADCKQTPTTAVCTSAKVCRPVGAPGMPCAEDQPCNALSYCAPSGRCLPRKGAGATCADAEECDVTRGVTCNKRLGTCVRFTIGSRCVANPDGTYQYCGGSAFCQSSGECLPPAADGAACDDENGPLCLWPAVCVEHVCRTPSVPACRS